MPSHPPPPRRTARLGPADERGDIAKLARPDSRTRKQEDQRKKEAESQHIHDPHDLSPADYSFLDGPKIRSGKLSFKSLELRRWSDEKMKKLWRSFLK